MLFQHDLSIVKTLVDVVGARQDRVVDSLPTCVTECEFKVGRSPVLDDVDDTFEERAKSLDSIGRRQPLVSDLEKLLGWLAAVPFGVSRVDGSVQCEQMVFTLVVWSVDVDHVQGDGVLWLSDFHAIHRFVNRDDAEPIPRLVGSVGVEMCWLLFAGRKHLDPQIRVVVVGHAHALAEDQHLEVSDEVSIK